MEVISKLHQEVGKEHEGIPPLVGEVPQVRFHLLPCRPFNFEVADFHEAPQENHDDCHVVEQLLRVHVRYHVVKDLVALEDGGVSKCVALAARAVGIRRGVFVLEGRLAVFRKEGRLPLRHCNQGGHRLTHEVGPVNPVLGVEFGKTQCAVIPVAVV